VDCGFFFVRVNAIDPRAMQSKAWFYRQYQREQSPEDRKLYDAAEAIAKVEKRGLWHDVAPIPPCDFRHRK
jgi:hypothetical protein